MVESALWDDGVMLLELVDDFDEILMDLVEIFKSGKVLGYFIFYGLLDFTKLLIDDLVHKEPNGFKLVITFLEHFLWVFGLTENGELTQKFIDYLDKFGWTLTPDTLEAFDVQIIEANFLMMKEMFLDTFRT